MPSTFHLVHSFLKIRLAGAPQPGLDDGTVDGVPVWQLIYFCLRCGDVGAAQEAARLAGPGLADTASLLAELTVGDRRLPPQTEAMVRLQYRRLVRQSADPYKRAVHCVLGGCDPQEEHSEVATSLDDWLWLDKSQLVEVLSRIGPIFIDDFNTINDKNESKAFNIRLAKMGIKTCITVDFGDGSKL